MNTNRLAASNIAVRLLSWDELDTAQRAATLNLRIDPTQLDFAGPIERAIEVLQADTVNDVAGLAIVCDATIVGFLTLKRRSQAAAWATNSDAVVTAMRIDTSIQGQGIGSQALMLLTEWVGKHWPECTRLALAVDESNVRGIRAYQRAGFVDSGVRDKGRVDWVRYMFKPLAPRTA